VGYRRGKEEAAEKNLATQDSVIRHDNEEWDGIIAEKSLG
jgi:hypothetical protein